jgi:DNA-directed RNA polymerase specialized sigma24 family protein
MIGAVVKELPGTLSGVRLGEFGAWMAAEQKRVYLLCRRMLQDPGEADCATQDVFLKAYNALNRMDSETEDPDAKGRWLTRIAVNTCLDRLRSKCWKIWQRRPAARDESARRGAPAVCDANSEKARAGSAEALWPAAGRFLFEALRRIGAGRDRGCAKTGSGNREVAPVQSDRQAQI